MAKKEELFIGATVLYHNQQQDELCKVVELLDDQLVIEFPDGGKLKRGYEEVTLVSGGYISSAQVIAEGLVSVKKIISTPRHPGSNDGPNLSTSAPLK